VSVTLDVEALIAYSDHERRKWKEWIAADPKRLDIAFQPGERFPTVASLLDHIFLVERRHLSRLEGATPPDATGVAPGDWQALFEYADLVQSDLRQFASELDDDRGQQTLTFSIQPGTFTMTRRKLLVHILLHEIRHLAQMAHAARAAGHVPPGEHDFFFCPTIR
jgi:uncharacterized damage-inducible protein DinB